jgi:hypothetical protein
MTTPSNIVKHRARLCVRRILFGWGKSIIIWNWVASWWRWVKGDVDWMTSSMDGH